jgi:Domain of unknown function (DUF4388)
MALEGKLSDFNLAEILQLISSQQKSGFLNLEATRDMVFIFDRGLLISTRDRRTDARDPLESFLRAYGFFNEDQWRHIEFVSSNSSLDLTEILVSENLFTEDELTQVLRSLAQVMTTSGMKLRRGSYHFNPTKGSPPGVHSRLGMDVQGLLMESARRLDEEELLRDALPNQNLVFVQGDKVIPPEALSPTGQHIMSLALAGLPLGRIIRQGKAESFVVRSLLKTWCEEGFLDLDRAAENEGEENLTSGSVKNIRVGLGLRRTPLVFLVVLLIVGLGWFRWSSPTIADTTAGDSLRENQLRSEVHSAAVLYRFREGKWPASLDLLVKEGKLDQGTLVTIGHLGWKYQLDSKKDQFSLGA